MSYEPHEIGAKVIHLAHILIKGIVGSSSGVDWVANRTDDAGLGRVDWIGTEGNQRGVDDGATTVQNG